MIDTMTKYQKIFREMLTKHRELFKSFEEIHAQYALDPEMWQVQFNQEGEKVLEVIRGEEDRLCSRSQGSGYASFTPKLAEKFREAVRDHFPMIDRVGIKKAAANGPPQPPSKERINPDNKPQKQEEELEIPKIRFS